MNQKLQSLKKYVLELTNEGEAVFKKLRSMLSSLDLSFIGSTSSRPSWRMTKNESYFNEKLKKFFDNNPNDKVVNRGRFLELEPVSQMLNYFYRIERKTNIKKSDIYKEFFKTPFVEQYCSEYGIEPATDESAKRRCPFILNILEALDFIKQKTSEIVLQTIVISPHTIRINKDETDQEIRKRITNFMNFRESKQPLSSSDKSALKEVFGNDFLTQSFYLDVNHAISSCRFAKKSVCTHTIFVVPNNEIYHS